MGIIENNTVLNVMPVGFDNRLSRKALISICGLSDRQVRKAIEDIVESKQAIIINMHKGYFIPNLENKTDRDYYRLFISQEESRINKLNKKMKSYNKMSEKILSDLNE